MGIEEEVVRGSNNIAEEARVRMSSLKVTTRREGIDVECIQGYADQRAQRTSIRFS
jgi:hypothetical protein